MKCTLRRAFLTLLLAGALSLSPARAQSPDASLDPAPTAPSVTAEAPPSPQAPATPRKTAPETKPSPATEGNKDSDASDLAKQTQNPVASLISVPFQSNTFLGMGQKKATAELLKIQPVIPQNFGEWNVIHRIIVPVAYLPYDAVIPSSQPSRGGGDFGLSDTTYTAFLSPATPGKLIWGFGPAITIPTASHKSLGQGKWNLGPEAVLLTMHGPIVTGVLLQQQWSVAGESGRPDVSAGLVQPFFNYNLPKGWYITTAPIATVNWNADRGQKWTVPIGGGVGRVFTIGKQAVNLSGQIYYNAIRPTDMGAWTLRVSFSLLFPTHGKH